MSTARRAVSLAALGLLLAGPAGTALARSRHPVPQQVRPLPPVLVPYELEDPDAEPEPRLSVKSPWPAGLNGGWFPARVTLENPREEAVRAALEFRTGWQENHQLDRTVVVPARSVLELEVVLPIDVDGGQEWSVAALGKGFYLGGQNLSTDGLQDVNARTVLVVREERTGEGVRVALAEAMGEGVTAAGTSHSGHWGGGLIAAIPRPSGSGSGPALYSLGFADRASLSADPRAYTSLDLVVLDVPLAALAREKLDALVSWVHTGGLLAVVGSGAESSVRAQPELGPWCESRFLVRAAELDGGAEVTAYQVGLGGLLLDESWNARDGSSGAEAAEPFADTLRRTVYQDLLSARPRYLPDRRGESPLAPRELAIPELGDIPFRGLGLFLVLFAVLLGPVNLLLVKRSGRPWLLLITVPGISLVASLGVLAWGLLKQGFDVRTHSRVLTVLDQRAHRAYGVEARAFFAGSSQVAALRLGAGTTLSALQRDWRSSGRELVFRIRDDEAGRELTGDYLPVRREVKQVLTMDTSARARLDVDWSGAAPRVTNGLGAELAKLVLADAQGALFSLRSPLAPGEATALAPGGNATLLLVGPWGPEALPEAWRGALPPATYAAQVAEPIGLDACGLELVRTVQKSLVLGVLELPGVPAIPGVPATQGSGGAR